MGNEFSIKAFKQTTLHVYVPADVEIRFSALYCFVIFVHVTKDKHPTIVTDTSVLVRHVMLT